MGLTFSIELCVKASSTTTNTKFSNSSIKLLKYQDHDFTPISFIEFIKSPESFLSSQIVIVEPIQNQKQNQIDDPSPAAYNSYSPEKIEQKISCTNFLENIFQLYTINVNYMTNYYLGILTPSQLPESSMLKCLLLCRLYQFKDVISTQCVKASDIFYDCSTSEQIKLATIFSSKNRSNLKSIITQKVEVKTKSKKPQKISTFTNNLTCCTANYSVSTDTKVNYNDNCDQITPNLFIGTEVTALNSSLLEQHKITHIVNIRNQGDSNLEKFQNIKYFSIILQDSVFENLNTGFWKCVQFLRESIRSGGNVLVQCRRGVSRSPTLCAAYLMMEKHMSFDSAYHLLREKRPIIKINKGFKEQLKIQESNLIHSIPKENGMGSTEHLFV